MAFRADEAAKDGFRRAQDLLISPAQFHHLETREECLKALEAIVREWGPIVRRYPIWHPLVNRGNDGNLNLYPLTMPSAETGFRGLDHTIYLANGFLTCPYSDGEDVVECVREIDRANVEAAKREGFHKLPALLEAEILDVKLYSSQTTTVLVKCTEWEMESDGTIPLKSALPLFLEKVLPFRTTGSVTETWKTMQGYFLGEPCGSVSSLHVNAKTGRALKKAYEMLQESGMFGPLYQGT